MSIRQRWYIGIKEEGQREAFRSAEVPTEATHGDLYAAVWGPFYTRRGARWAEKYTVGGNPHAQLAFFSMNLRNDLLWQTWKS